MFKPMIFAAALVGAATSANAVTNLLVNPGFEVSTTVDGFVPAGSAVLSGWTVSGAGAAAGVYVAGAGSWAAAGGTNSNLLWGDGALGEPGIANTGASGTIGQLVDVVAGKEYTLKFSYTADPSIPGNAGRLATGLFSFDIQNVGIGFIRPAVYSVADPGWLTVEYTFVAASTGPTLLSFNGNSPNRRTAVAVDAISLTVVPEPATWALLITGFGLVGFSVRSRRAALSSVTL